MKRRSMFAVYCVLAVWLLFARERYAVEGAYWARITENVNLVPLQTVARYVRLLTGDYSVYLKCHALFNLLGNVMLFLPFGYWAPMLWEGFRSFWKCILKGGLFVVGVELLQLFLLLGRCDVDDLLLNALGVALGYGVFHIRKTENSS